MGDLFDSFDPLGVPKTEVSNLLLGREPDLVGRLAEFRQFAVDHLLHALMHRDRKLAMSDPPHSREDAQAVAIVLRVLTKPAWTHTRLGRVRRLLADGVAVGPVRRRVRGSEVPDRRGRS
jgi:hypothetical protein